MSREMDNMYIIFVLGIIAVCVSLTSSKECSGAAVYREISEVQYSTAYETYSYTCGWWSWRRCRGTRSYRRSIIFYRQLVNQETCCDGYELFNDTCVPICSNCTSPRVCVSPNECLCPDNRYTGESCDQPICTSCMMPRVCFEPEKCACPTGWTGETCSNDVNECSTNASSIGPCEQQCANTNGSFYCDCDEGYKLGSDRVGCIGSVSNVQLMISATNNVTLSVSWRPPLAKDNLLGYNLSCISDQAESNQLINHTTTTWTVTAVMNPPTRYNCCVTVITLNGLGASVCATTAEDENGAIKRSTAAAVIGGGIFGALLALLLLIAIIATVVFMVYKWRKTSSDGKITTEGTETMDRVLDNPVYGMDNRDKEFDQDNLEAKLTTQYTTAFEYESIRFTNEDKTTGHGETRY